MSLSEKELTQLKVSHETSRSYHQSRTGYKYYNTDNDILDRKLYIYTEAGLIEDPYKANNKITSDYYKMLIDQCVSYLLAKKPQLSFDYDIGFHTQLIEISKMAKSQGLQWVRLFVSNNEIQMELMNGCEMYPVYDDNGELIEMYRFYSIGEDDYIERYFEDGLELYKNKIYVETKSHMNIEIKKGAEIKRGGLSWGKVPFICMKNNEEGTYDLKTIKTLIDNYDKIISDFANNLEDSQDVYWILKGFNGNLSAFTEQVKMYKSIPVGNDGDVKAETLDIPHEARMVALDKLESLIFKFGKGVNIERLAGGSLTNVHIKAMFANLDIKANEFATQVKKFIMEYIEFYNIYAGYIGIEQINYEEDIYFNKSVIINESEMLQSNVMQKGFISEDTRLDNHIWVEDVEEEKKKMEAQPNITALFGGEE
jgi:SPP1 family phage portal protein